MKFNPKTDIPDLSGKVVLVTGGNVGLGRESILQLAQHKPAHIWLAARSREKAEAAIAEVKETVPDAPITWLPLDLASCDSITAAAKKFQQSSDRLDVLMNNAGVMDLPNGKTSDGFEIHFGTNHIGPFLFTKLLMPVLQKTAKSGADVRIVNLTSEAHNFMRIRGFVLDKEKMQKLGPWEAYGNSKLANILFARECAARYPNITSVSVHPGIIVGTGLYGNVKSGILGKLGVTMMSYVFPDVPTGTHGQLWAATCKKSDIKNGGYYVPVGKLSTGSPQAKSTEKDSELWQWTENELKSKGY